MEKYLKTSKRHQKMMSLFTHFLFFHTLILSKYSKEKKHCEWRWSGTLSLYRIKNRTIINIYIVFAVFRLNHISLHRSKKLGSYTVFCLNNVISVYSREQYTLFLLSFKLRKGKLLIINLINYWLLKTWLFFWIKKSTHVITHLILNNRTINSSPGNFCTIRLDVWRFCFI